MDRQRRASSSSLQFYHPTSASHSHPSSERTPFKVPVKYAPITKSMAEWSSEQSNNSSSTIRPKTSSHPSSSDFIRLSSTDSGRIQIEANRSLQAHIVKYERFATPIARINEIQQVLEEHGYIIRGDNSTNDLFSGSGDMIDENSPPSDLCMLGDVRAHPYAHEVHEEAVRRIHYVQEKLDANHRAVKERVKQRKENWKKAEEQRMHALPPRVQEVLYSHEVMAHNEIKEPRSDAHIAAHPDVWYIDPNLCETAQRIVSATQAARLSLSSFVDHRTPQNEIPEIPLIQSSPFNDAEDPALTHRIREARKREHKSMKRDEYSQYYAAVRKIEMAEARAKASQLTKIRLYQQQLKKEHRRDQQNDETKSEIPSSARKSETLGPPPSIAQHTEADLPPLPTTVSSSFVLPKQQKKTPSSSSKNRLHKSKRDETFRAQIRHLFEKLSHFSNIPPVCACAAFPVSQKINDYSDDGSGISIDPLLLHKNNCQYYGSDELPAYVQALQSLLSTLEGLHQ